ncbi:MAG: hypothetical protein ACI84R_001531 [Candidatus Azotimanducaceae bacterium]|jgi:hypothetical protein
MIRFILITATIVVGIAAGGSWASPDISLRPVARAGTGARNVGELAQRPLEAQLQLVAATTNGTGNSLRPALRPSSVVTKAMARKRKRLKGAICGDPDIQGDAIGRVPGKLSGCGVQDAVRVRSVAGVTLSQQSVMDCGTAKALKTWVNKGAKPAVGSKGGGLSGLKVAAHYSCRTRNNKKGAKISEHGKGRAIDISGLVLNDGRTITVLKGWHNADRRTMRRAHKTACGPFGTVLGPNADRYHQDHFHFDTARYRSGSYCR